MENSYKSEVNFYQQITPFIDYNEIFESKHYKKVPENWFVIFTDVMGSTEAVKNGKYRDVNMVGAMIISAITNSFKCQLPFSFGGDGSLIFIPPEFLEKAENELQKCLYISSKFYNLKLRGAIIPLKDVYAFDSSTYIEVAKYQLSENNYTAQFRGDGLKIVERIAKSGLCENKYLKKSKEGKPNLDGLSCRWAPMPNTKGTIASIIINSFHENEIKKSISYIEKILGRTLNESSPVMPENINPSWPPRLDLEAKANISNLIEYKKVYRKTFWVNLLAFVIIRLNLNIAGFNTKKYKQEVSQNSDYKKYDDSLKMVIDCSLEEAEKIKEYLDSQRIKGCLTFGIHLSTNAVMTCYVQSTDNQHIHFIDGEGGGYTQASVQVKNSPYISKKSA